MKIAVFGTPQFSADIFETISQTPNIEVVVAVTAPDRPAGRGKKMTPPPVKMWAEQKGISVFQSEKPNTELCEELKKMGVELCIVIAYGYIFRKDFLAPAPPAWNLHLSLLPKYRGSSPVPAAILAGDTISGVTVFHIQKGMDDGPMLGKKEFDISGDRADEVYRKIEQFGSKLLSELLTKKADRVEIPEIPQDETQATFCKKVTKQDGFLYPEKESAESALQKIRAYHPWPGTSVDYNGKRLKIINAADFPPEGSPPDKGEVEGVLKGETRRIDIKPGQFLFEKSGTFLGFSSGALELIEVQMEGKRAVSGEDFARGQKN